MHIDDVDKVKNGHKKFRLPVPRAYFVYRIADTATSIEHFKELLKSRVNQFSFNVMYDFSRAHNNMFSINVCKWLELSVDCIHLSSQPADTHTHTYNRQIHNLLCNLHAEHGYDSQSNHTFFPQFHDYLFNKMNENEANRIISSSKLNGCS